MQNMSPDIAANLAVQASNAGVPVLYVKNTNADSLGIRAEVNNNTSNNAIIEAVNIMEEKHIWDLPVVDKNKILSDV